jgi:hypothetical protein
MAQAVRPVAGDFQIDAQIIVDRVRAFMIEPRHHQPLIEFLGRHGEREVFLKPVPGDEHNFLPANLNGNASMLLKMKIMNFGEILAVALETIAVSQVFRVCGEVQPAFVDQMLILPQHIFGGRKPFEVVNVPEQFVALVSGSSVVSPKYAARHFVNCVV